MAAITGRIFSEDNQINIEKISHKHSLQDIKVNSIWELCKDNFKSICESIGKPLAYITLPITALPILLASFCQKRCLQVLKKSLGEPEENKQNTGIELNKTSQVAASSGLDKTNEKRLKKLFSELHNMFHHYKEGLIYKESPYINNPLSINDRLSEEQKEMLLLIKSSCTPSWEKYTRDEENHWFNLFRVMQAGEQFRLSVDRTGSNWRIELQPQRNGRWCSHPSPGQRY